MIFEKSSPIDSNNKKYELSHRILLFNNNQE